jgi:hypothetical protein
MTAISPAHVEWATVDRMRRMLPRPHRGFEVTGTLALFTGILCWTMQRISTEANETDDISRRMVVLSKRLQAQPFWQFLKTEPKALLTTSADRSGVRTEIALNSLTEFVEDGKPLTAYRSLRALRNAAGHADARRLTPINDDGKLIGYRFACNRAYQAKSGEWVEKWQGTISLDAAGMASIARELADQFCAALQDGDDRFATDASRVREVRSL